MEKIMLTLGVALLGGWLAGALPVYLAVRNDWKGPFWSISIFIIFIAGAQIALRIAGL